MNLLHFSKADIAGGAAQAAHQLHTLLREAGHKSVMAVRHKVSGDPNVIQLESRTLMNCSWQEKVERGRSRLAGGYGVKPIPYRDFNLNLAPVPNLQTAFEILPHPDVIFLHWITGLLTAADIRRLWQRTSCPLIWVLMDLEPLTGGCHYPGDCIHYRAKCGNCPQLQKGGAQDWAWRTWQEKYRQLKDLPITFVAPTKWVEERLSASSLFKNHHIVHIPLPMKASLRPEDRSIARKVLNLPANKKIVFVGSQNLKDPRKGMDRLVAAANSLAAAEASGLRATIQDNLLFLIMGNHAQSLAAQIPFPCHDMGYVRSEIELALAYQASDVFASPSLEDAGPMMVSQAMLCGTPVVAFDTGIAKELITTGENGYVATQGDAKDFARGLAMMLSANESAGQNAAAVANHHHSPQSIAHSYATLLTHLTRLPPIRGSL